MGEGQTPGIDLVKEPQEWINGFDAGFNNRPLILGNTRQYCKGYLDGQHAWHNPVVSPSLSSTATEASSSSSLYPETIDPRLLDLNASEYDDVVKTPTQLTVGAHLADGPSNIVNEPHSLPLGSSSHDIIQPPESNAPRPSSPSNDVREAVPGFGHQSGHNNSVLETQLPVDALDVHDVFISQQLQAGNPFQAHKASRASQVPTSYTLRPPPLPLNAQGNIASMSMSVRWRLAMAKDARRAADLFESQGNLDAAAAAVIDATRWEKTARRRQGKNESQNRIRAQKRAQKKAR